nr:hypothetical protein [Parabacteroides goldsteinii]
MEKEHIEQQVAEIILQKTIEVHVGDMVYEAAPASTATLILVSGLVSQLPIVQLSEDNVMIETLSIAQDCRVLGDILAVLILGAKGLKETREVIEPKLFGLWSKKKTVVIDKQAELADILLKELSPRNLNSLLVELLTSMEIADFFGLITSLLEVNLLRQTREVGTTVSGR